MEAGDSETSATRGRAGKPTQSRWRWLALAMIAVIALGGGGWTYQRYHRQKLLRGLIPASARQQVNFPLYYPARLPNGYSVSSLPVVSEAVLVMSVTSASGNVIFISEQAAPTSLNYQDFLSAQLKRPQEVSTPIGLGYIGGPLGRVLGSILTARTWVLLNTRLSGNSESEMKQVMVSLAISK